MSRPDNEIPIAPLIVAGGRGRAIGITGVNPSGKYRHASVPFAESEPPGIGAALARAEQVSKRAAADHAAALLSVHNENLELSEREPE